jgi:hypothetical protein
MKEEDDKSENRCNAAIANHCALCNDCRGAMDAYAFSIEADRAFMSRLFMNITTNIPHYPQWMAYLKDRQPKTLIVWGRNDPIIWPAAAEAVETGCPNG